MYLKQFYKATSYFLHHLMFLFDAKWIAQKIIEIIFINAETFISQSGAALWIMQGNNAKINLQEHSNGLLLTRRS